MVHLFGQRFLVEFGPVRYIPNMIVKAVKVEYIESQVEFGGKNLMERRELVENLVPSVGRYTTALCSQLEGWGSQGPSCNRPKKSCVM